ncbi:MAG: DUF420 domain-containing protein [Myxococcaceae bacterium]|nr:DUF420 domain-containing protein [Myxococcaceae bacterium]
MDATLSSRDKRFFVFNTVVTVGAVALLGYLLLIRGGTPDAGLDLHFMPAVNASLNALAAVLLFVGWRFAKAGRSDIHRFFMIAAMVATGLFLVCYLAYHSVHGDTKYGGTGALRAVYFALLLTHVPASMFVFPAALAAVYFGVTAQPKRHTKLTRILFPVWMYVSVTGVLIFFMLRGSPTAS